MARQSSGASSGLLQRIATGALTIDLAAITASDLDCSQAAAVFSKARALRSIVVGAQQHEGAPIPFIRFDAAPADALAMQCRIVAPTNEVPAFHCIVDAQVEPDVEGLTVALRALQASSAMAVMVSSPEIARKMSRDTQLADMRFLASLNGDVVPYLEDNFFIGAPPRPALYLSGETLTRMGDHVAGLAPALAGCANTARLRVTGFSIEA